MSISISGCYLLICFKINFDSFEKKMNKWVKNPLESYFTHTWPQIQQLKSSSITNINVSRIFDAFTVNFFPTAQSRLTHISIASFLWDIGKQCRSRLFAVEYLCSVKIWVKMKKIPPNNPCDGNGPFILTSIIFTFGHVTKRLKPLSGTQPLWNKLSRYDFFSSNEWLVRYLHDIEKSNILTSSPTVWHGSKCLKLSKGSQQWMLPIVQIWMLSDK